MSWSGGKPNCKYSKCIKSKIIKLHFHCPISITQALYCMFRSSFTQTEDGAVDCVSWEPVRQISYWWSLTSVSWFTVVSGQYPPRYHDWKCICLLFSVCVCVCVFSTSRQQWAFLCSVLNWGPRFFLSSWFPFSHHQTPLAWRGCCGPRYGCFHLV